MEGNGEPDLAPDEATAPPVLDGPAPAPVNVVAVVVTRNPGVALDDTLASLLGQDQRNLSILVIDDGSDDAVFDRVAAVAPGAFVRRCERPIGFGAAANLVTEMVQGASHYLFCHDDIALAPDAVRLLAASAVSMAAAVAGPKVVAWENHERFLSLGYAIDRVGTPVSLVELDELDQGQHDQMREVTAAHGAALLVRTETFATIGGYLASLTDPSTGTNRGSGVAPGPDLGEDLDLCLRARRAGGRVIIVPSARVAHQGLVHGLSEAVESPALARPIPSEPEVRPVAEQRLLRERNRIRSIVANATGTQLVIVLPLLLLQALRRGAPSAAAVGGRRSRFTALRLALGRRADRSSAHAQAKRSGHGDLGRELVPVSRRFRAGVRSDVTADTARLWRVAERALGSRRGGRLAVGSFALVGAIVVFGSRGLFGSGIGRAGRLVPLPPVGDLWRLALSGWHEPALGHFGVVDPGLALTAFAATIALGATGLVGTLMGVAPLLLGGVGMWRSVRDGSTVDEGRIGVAIGASVTYLLAPIPFDALSTGNRAALWGYALFPWFMRSVDRVLRGHRQNESEANRSPHRRSWGLRRLGVGDASALRLAMLLAVCFALGPATSFVWVQTILLVGLAVAVTSGRGALRSVARHGVVAFAGALVLVFPLVVSLVRSGFSGWSFVGDDAARTSHFRIDELLRLHSAAHGAIGSALFGGFFVIGAVFPLLVADGERLLLAIRCWMLIVGSVLLAWLAGRGWLPAVVPGPALLLLPAAYGSCRAAAEGLGALVAEVRRRGFGWRQGFAGIALISVALSALPVVSASGNGRWGRPLRGSVDKLSWMRGRNDGGFRVAFLGDPAVLPGSPYRLGPSLGLTVSRDGIPTIDDQWSVIETPRLAAFREALLNARSGATTRLGADLAALSVRYLVVVERAVSSGPRHAIPTDLRQSLLDQIDLRAVDSAPDLTVYENDAWVPTVWSPLTSAAGLDRNGVVNTAGASVALLPKPLFSDAVMAPSASVGDGGTVNRGAELLDALRRRPPRSSYEGAVESDSLLIASVPPDKNWQLHAGRSTIRPIALRSLIDAGGTVRAGALFSGYSVPATATNVELSPRRPISVTAELLLLVVLWCGALAFVARDRRRQQVLRAESVSRFADGQRAADQAEADGDFMKDMFGDDEFADPFPMVRRARGQSSSFASSSSLSSLSSSAASTSAPGTAVMSERADGADELPVDGSVSDELWSRFAERRREESDELDESDESGEPK